MSSNLLTGMRIVQSEKFSAKSGVTFEQLKGRAESGLLSDIEHQLAGSGAKRTGTHVHDRSFALRSCELCCELSNRSERHNLTGEADRRPDGGIYRIPSPNFIARQDGAQKARSAEQCGKALAVRSSFGVAWPFQGDTAL
jgi:hypothetical protein